MEESTFSFERRAFLRAGLTAGVVLLTDQAVAAAAAVRGDDLAALSVGELSRQLRGRKLSVTELVEGYLDRIVRYDGRDGINAYITVDREGALKQAQQLDRLIQQGKFLGPLHGIPLAVKDNLDTSGLRTTGGSKVLANWLPKENATVVKRMRDCGGIVLGKTNLHELAFGVTTNNPHYGATRNPYDRTRIPGGSSGGSAAAVAAGLCAAAIGTDTGGSVRIPAALCGIVGLKPTLGRVGRGGMLYLSFTRDVIGPMTRTVEDAALLLRAIAGPDSRDPDASSRHVPDYTRALLPGLKGVKFGVPRKQFYEENDREVERLTEQALKALEGLGAVAVEVEIDDLDLARPTGVAIVLAEAIYQFETYLKRFDPTATVDKYLPEFGHDVQAILGGQKGTDQATPVAGYTYLEAIRTNRGRVVRGFERALEQVDVLVTPTTPLPAARIGEEIEVELRGKKVNTFRTFIKHCDPVSVAGLPAISVPAGWATGGLPVGVQFVGKAWDEERIIRVAFAYEQATRWRRPPTL